MDLKTLVQTVNQIAQEKKIEPEKIFDVVEKALAAAYKREYSERNANVRAKLDIETGKMRFVQVKDVVDEATVRFEAEEETADSEDKLPRFNEERHILLEEAKKIKPDAVVGDEMEFPLPEQENFGRIAAGTAKQVIIQRLREAEQESVVEEFKDREGQIVSGTVQRMERGNVYIDLGRAVGIMFYNETIPGEHYRIGERLRFYVVAVQKGSPRFPEVVLSRSHPRFIVKLFELEVPEIADGTVEIKVIAREAGSRTKIAVASNHEAVDAVGSVVGQHGTRIMTVTNELGPERIDVVGWSEDIGTFIKNALAPARVHRVEELQRREVRVFVPDDQLSLAIGKGGQNVRLAAKLTGWKIDVRSESRPDEAQEGGVAEVEQKTSEAEEDEETPAKSIGEPALEEQAGGNVEEKSE
ncbi:MAG: transcription termination/antitermination protein NusA [Patescibacteria group bacterium]|nr:transcription termination/antitermination protein NusA [Patescibacteria group bacterium]